MSVCTAVATIQSFCRATGARARTLESTNGGPSFLPNSSASKESCRLLANRLDR